MKLAGWYTCMYVMYNAVLISTCKYCRINHFFIIIDVAEKFFYKYTFLRSALDVIFLHFGQSFLLARAWSQHFSQYTCQHLMDTKGLW